MSSALHTEQLSKRFRRVEALTGLDLDVPEGSIYALVGPNGAGKTTAIKILMNIFPPTSGRAEVLGTDSRRIAGRAFTSIGYVSENQKLPNWMPVGYFLKYLRPFYPAWDTALENELVEQFQLPRERKLGHLSRGMRMKAALVSALAYHPKLIVLDEPFGGLDPLVRDELVAGLLDRASEASILISSHDLAEIENLATHVGYLEQGRLRFSDEMATLMARFREVEVTLEASPAARDTWPPSWIQVNTAASVVRFVETSFDSQRTASAVREAFPNLRNVTYTPMSLRAIFLAMAKAGRNL